MNLDEFRTQILKLIPNAQLDEDNYGQIIIYTNKTVDEFGEVVPWFNIEDFIQKVIRVLDKVNDSVERRQQTVINPETDKLYLERVALADHLSEVLDFAMKSLP